jgi:hypothetical protein
MLNFRAKVSEFQISEIYPYKLRSDAKAVGRTWAVRCGLGGISSQYLSQDNRQRSGWGQIECTGINLDHVLGLEKTAKS